MNISWRLTKATALLCSIVMLSASSSPGTAGPYNYVPREGYIRDEVLAARIGELILKSIYGEAAIEGEKPLKVTLEGDVWTIEGTAKRGKKGGVAEIRISKTTGQVLSVTHGK